MTGLVYRSRHARPRVPSRIDGALHLNVPPESGFKKGNLLIAAGILCVVAIVLRFGGHALRSVDADDDQVQIVVTAPAPPPPPPPVVTAPPAPRPVPPDPDRPPPPPSPKDVPPPPPVFGLAEDATSKAGDMAVATGNTLMKPADSIVQKAPPPLQAAPVQLNRQPAIVNQVIPEYPSWAEEQGVTATVKLQVTIDGAGKVREVVIVGSGGNDFARNAVKAVKATRFQPLVRQGIAFPAQFLFTYQFVL
jgi:protein TonB